MKYSVIVYGVLIDAAYLIAWPRMAFTILTQKASYIYS